MNKRDLSLDKYGISKYRYRELYNFCLQYEEFIKQKQDCYCLKAITIDGLPKSSKKYDLTGINAERAYMLGKNIEMIEQTAIEAAEDLYPWLLKIVTSDALRWSNITPPCGANQFREIRRKFYYLLSLKKR